MLALTCININLNNIIVVTQYVCAVCVCVCVRGVSVSMRMCVCVWWAWTRQDWTSIGGGGGTWAGGRDSSASSSSCFVSTLGTSLHLHHPPWRSFTCIDRTFRYFSATASSLLSINNQRCWPDKRISLKKMRKSSARHDYCFDIPVVRDSPCPADREVIINSRLSGIDIPDVDCDGFLSRARDAFILHSYITLVMTMITTRINWTWSTYTKVA